MFATGQDTTQNHLLRILSREDWSRLAPSLEAVDLEPRAVLSGTDADPSHVYFPESGIVSMMAELNGRSVEVGLYGRDGFSGVSVLLGVDRVGYEHRAQTPMRASRLEVAAFREVLEASPALRGLLLRYVHVKMVQTAGAAAANALFTIEQRLARWLLMYDDRLEPEGLPVTHETLGVLLGVRRSSVTVALHRLEGAKLVGAKRGRIVVLDRAGLELAAQASYGAAEAEYARLLGAFRVTAAL